MRKFKKNLFAVIAAVSLVANTGYVSNVTDVYAQEAAEVDLADLYVYNPASGSVKFTNKPLELSLRYFDSYAGEYEGEEILLEKGVDYDVIGYLPLGRDEYYDSGEEYDISNVTKGLPTEKGKYVIFIEGKGNYKGTTGVEINIIDPKALEDAHVQNYLAIVSYKEISIAYSYYDSEKDEEIYAQEIKEDVDYTYVGWVKADDYNNGPVSNWNSGNPTKEGSYVFKFVGKGEYTGELCVELELADIMDVSSYSFDFPIRYNAEKKAYERYLYCNLLDSKNYKVSYCTEEEYDNALYPTMKEGFPEEPGSYAIVIEGVSPYKGTSMYYYKVSKNDIFALDGEKITLKDLVFNTDYYVVICPTETKEYEISSSNRTSGSAYGILFDEYYNYIDENYGDSVDDNFTIKQTLEAGKLYILYIGSYTEEGTGVDKFSIDINIKGGYKYNAPVVNEANNDDSKDAPKTADKKDEFKAPKVGSVISDKQFKYTVKKAVTKKGEIGEVELAGFKKKETKNVKVADKVKIDGNTYKVTSIAKNAFKGSKKVTRVVIGKNVAKIGAGAFANIAGLKKVTIKSTKLTKIGRKAFNRKKGKKVTFVLPKAKKKAYKKLLKKAKTNKYKVK